ncbi:hypothetical protein Amsp01_012940 [Amycolatopsis sp. NBRC 101858]|nr:hypothetical protein Amsp01_012940 [Amycolatopsis sp. NBRC 101858]
MNTITQGWSGFPSWRVRNRTAEASTSSTNAECMTAASHRASESAVMVSMLAPFRSDTSVSRAGRPRISRSDDPVVGRDDDRIIPVAG